MNYILCFTVGIQFGLALALLLIKIKEFRQNKE